MTITLAAQIDAIRNLIEHRAGICGPRIYIAADLDEILRAVLRTLEETQSLTKHLEQVALNRWGPPLDLEDEESAA